MILLERRHVERHADVPSQQRIQTLGVARWRSHSASMKAGGGSSLQAARLTAAAPRLELRFAHGERQQLIAHRLGGPVALVNQRRRPAANRAIHTSPSGTLMTTSAAAMARRVDARIIASRVSPATPSIV